MSFRRQYSLDSHKLTRHTSGRVSKTVIHRGCSSGAKQEVVASSASNSDSGSLLTDSLLTDSLLTDSLLTNSLLTDSLLTENLAGIEPSHHELETKSSILGWNKIRSGLLTAFTESECMAVSQICSVCLVPALIRCQECGPGTYYCIQCFGDEHTTKNIFHAAEKWEVRFDYSIHILCN